MIIKIDTLIINIIIIITMIMIIWMIIMFKEFNANDDQSGADYEKKCYHHNDL